MASVTKAAEVTAMRGRAAEAVNAALVGLHPLPTCKVSASEYDGVVQQLASARLEQVSACQQRDETLQNYMELEEDSSRIIQGLRQEVRDLQTKLYTCQREICRYQRAVDEKMSDIRKRHHGLQRHISTLEADKLQLEQKYEQVQRILQVKDAEIERLIKDKAQCASILFNVLPTGAKPPRHQPAHLVRKVDDLTRQVEKLQQQLSVLQDELAERELEVAVLPTDAWGFKAASSAVTTANMATQTDIEVACDDSDDDEEELLEAQQEQAHVQVVLNVRESFMEEANLKALNINLQSQLDVCKKLVCHYEQDLAAMRVQNQQLKGQNKHLEQQVFDMTEKLVEFEQEKVSLVLNVSDVVDEAVIVGEVQPVIALAINANEVVETSNQIEIDGLRVQLAATACQYQTEMTAVQVENQRLHERVIALQHLVAERDDRIQELEQMPKVKMVVNVAEDSISLVEQAQLKVAELKQQVSELNQSKLLLATELDNRDRCIVQHQHQLAATMQALNELQASAQVSTPPVTKPTVDQAADTDAVTAAAPKYLSALRATGSSNSKSRVSIADLSSSQPGTPGTPALMTLSRFGIGRGSSSCCSSGDDVEQHNSAADISSPLTSTAADDVSTVSEDDSSRLLISPQKPEQPRHRNLFKGMKRRLRGPSTCLTINSSAVKE